MPTDDVMKPTDYQFHIVNSIDAYHICAVQNKKYR